MNHKNIKTILLVEDEALVAVHMEEKIRGFGYKVMTVYSGEDAVSTATENENINLVLMDIDMGKGMDGTEAARQILAKRHVPIVFHTAHMEAQYVQRVKEITRYGYVIKNSGDFVLKSSIEMAFELFNEHQKTRESEARYKALYKKTQNQAKKIEAQNKALRDANNKLATTLHKLRESENRAKALLNAIPDMMFRLSQDGTYLDYKARQSQLYIPLDTPTLIGLRIRDIYPPEFSERAEQFIQKALATDEIQIFEYQIHIPGKGLRDHEARMVPSGENEVTAIVRDVTGRKQAEAEIRKFKEKYLMLVEASEELRKANESKLSLSNAEQEQRGG